MLAVQRLGIRVASWVIEEITWIPLSDILSRLDSLEEEVRWLRSRQAELESESVTHGR